MQAAVDCCKWRWAPLPACRPQAESCAQAVQIPWRLTRPLARRSANHRQPALAIASSQRPTAVSQEPSRCSTTAGPRAGQDVDGRRPPRPCALTLLAPPPANRRAGPGGELCCKCVHSRVQATPPRSPALPALRPPSPPPAWWGTWYLPPNLGTAVPPDATGIYFFGAFGPAVWNDCVHLVWAACAAWGQRWGPAAQSERAGSTCPRPPRPLKVMLPPAGAGLRSSPCVGRRAPSPAAQAVSTFKWVVQA